MTTYTVKRYTGMTDKLWTWLAEELPRLSNMYGWKLDHNNANLEYLLKNCIFLVAKRNGHISGVFIASISCNPLDMSKKTLRQVLFYVSERSGRTAYHLFKAFVDIGKKEAHHIIMTLTEHTNVKPSTLEGYGFKKLETLYRLEN